MATESNGTSHWLINIPAGTYADGAFITTHSGQKMFLFKYSPTGEFLAATPFDLEVTATYLSNLQFYRNPQNGYYFITSQKTGTGNDYAIAGGVSITNLTFLSSFDNDCQFLWKQGNTSSTPNTMSIFNILFDSDNSIYVTGKIVGLVDSFVGLTVDEAIIPGFVMKLSSNGQNTIWSTYHNKSSSDYGAIALNNDVVAFTSTGFGTDFTWGGQTIFVSDANQGNEVIFARFDKNTGSCSSLTKLPGDIGYDDYGSALAVDASGDYIVGGGFAHFLYLDNGASLLNQGQSTDFFIAKYANEACSELSVTENERTKTKAFPNPASNFLTVNVSNRTAYEIFAITGTVLDKGVLTSSANLIKVDQFSQGTYIIKLVSEDGKVEKIKFIKQ